MKKRSKIEQLNFSILMVCMVLDGFFTFIGIQEYGLSIEGNPLIVYISSLIGYELALLFVKLVGIIIIYVWYKFLHSSSWLHPVLLLLASYVYFHVVAIWATFLIQEGLLW
jgi:hypothetical protein